MLLRHPQRQHAEVAHVAEDLARHEARLLPRVAVRRHLFGDEFDRLLVDGLEVFRHLGVAQRHSGSVPFAGPSKVMRTWLVAT